MDYQQTPQAQGVDLSAIVPTFTSLVHNYGQYLIALEHTVNSLEKADDLQRNIRELLRPDFATRIPEIGRAEELSQLLARVENISPESQIFSLDDIGLVRQVVAQSIDGDGIEELFSKLCSLEKVMNRNVAVFGGGRSAEPALFDEVQRQSDRELSRLSTAEFIHCISLINAVRESALASVEATLGNRQSNISECRAALIAEIGGQSELFQILRDRMGELSPVLQEFNAWAVEHFQRQELGQSAPSKLLEAERVNSYLEWRYGIVGDLESLAIRDDLDVDIAPSSSLEDRLGARSSVNHFDAFLLRPQGRIEFHFHFHEPLNMRIFLALANPVCDVAVYQASEGTVSQRRMSRGIDFLVPAYSGVVEIPKVSSLMMSQGR